MATPNFGFQTISDSNKIDIVNAVNTPITQIDTALAGIAPLDTTPTSGSTKGVTSDGIYSAITKSYQYSELHVCGDSFSNDSSEWPTIVAAALGFTLYNHAANSAAFTSTSNSIVSQINSAISQANKHALLIIYGGINDFNDLSASTSTMNDMFTSLASTIKNAIATKQIGVIFAFGNMGAVNQSKYVTYPNWYFTCFDNLVTIGMPGLVYGVPFWLLGRSNVFESDNLHLNTNGQNVIASYFIQIINGTFTGAHYKTYANSSITANSSDYNGKAIWSFDNDIITVKINSNGTLRYNNTEFTDLNLHPASANSNVFFGGIDGAASDYNRFQYPGAFSTIVVSSNNVGISRAMINVASSHIYCDFYGSNQNNLTFSRYGNFSFTYPCYILSL